MSFRQKWKKQEQKLQLFLTWDDVVYPSKAMEYEAGLKGWVNLNSKYKFPHPVTAYKTNNNHNYSLIPIEKLADIDDLEKFWTDVKEKAGKEYRKNGR